MRQFAYKRFDTPSELKENIKSYLAKNAEQKIKVIEAKPGLKIKSLDKKSLNLALKEYLYKRKLLSGIIKEEIRKAFVELKLNLRTPMCYQARLMLIRKKHVIGLMWILSAWFHEGLAPSKFRNE